MARQLSPIINGRYIQDVFDSGLCFDLRMLHPQDYANTDKLNAKVDEVMGILNADPKHQQWRPCLGLLERQWADIRQDLKEILHEKIYILLYKSGWENGMAWPDLPVYHLVDFVCVPEAGKTESEWTVYSPWDANTLAYRFKTVPLPESEPEEPPVVEPEPVSPAINVRLECLKLAVNTYTAYSSNVIGSDDILALAGKFSDWVNGV